MRFKYDHDLHIHSHISACSKDAEQTKERILQYAKENGLHTVCLTDHFWDENVLCASSWYNANHKFEQITKAKPLPEVDGIKFLFGCETELDKHCTLGISPKRFDDFDVILIPTTHMHMNNFTVESSDYCNPSRLAKLWVERLEAVFKMNLPYHKVGIAHLTCGLIAKPREKYLETLSQIPSEEMCKVFKKAASLGVGIELNAFDMDFLEEEKEIVLRPYRIAKECGCKFYCGSDAHHPADFEECKNFEKVIEYLGLEEKDKWLICK